MTAPHLNLKRVVNIISERFSFLSNIKLDLYNKMLKFCEKNRMYKNTFIHQAIISRLIFDEDFQKEILSNIDTEFSSLYYSEIKNAFSDINKFKAEYEKCLGLIVIHIMKDQPKIKKSNNIKRPRTQNNPERTENHLKAIDWILISPEGVRYECHNLMHFIRQNPDLFGIDGSDKEVARISNGLRCIKTNMIHGRKMQIYNGWRIELTEIPESESKINNKSEE